MDRIRIFLSTLVLMFCIMQVNAQSFQLKDLIGKTWVGVSGYNGCEYIDWTMTFTEKSSEHHLASKSNNDQSSVFTYNMYLSDVEPKSYDASLLGKNQSGKYMVLEKNRIVQDQNTESFYYLEFVSLTTNNLIVKANGLTITFKSK